MKPALSSNEKTCDTKALTETQQRSPMKRQLTYVAVGLMLILLVGLVILAAMIYSNTKINKKSIEAISDTETVLSAIEKGFESSADQMTGKSSTEDQTENSPSDKADANITFHIVETGEELKENIMVSGNEEIITTEDAKFIYDYASGLMTLKLVGPEYNVCYVTHFNVSGSIERVKADVQNSMADVYATQTKNVTYVSTGAVSNETLLSPVATTLCDDSKLVWINRTTELDGNTQRIRRGCSWVYRQYCYYTYTTETKQTCTKRWFKTRCKYYTYQKKHKKCIYIRVWRCW